MLKTFNCVINTNILSIFTNNFITDNKNKHNMKELNLCELLKGHEGEVFYSRCSGEVELIKVYEKLIECKSTHDGSTSRWYRNGKYFIAGKLDLYPAKNRSWKTWIEAQKSYIPKTWSEFINKNYKDAINGQYDYCVNLTEHSFNGWTRNDSLIEKAALALLKINQLIEASYGGTVTYERASLAKYPNVFKIVPCSINNSLKFIVKEVEDECEVSHIMFHDKEQAEEFLLYLENIQLLKDYYMTN